MIERAYELVKRRNLKKGGLRDPAGDWRATIRRRALTAVAFFGLWAAGIEARLVTLQVFEHSDLVARAKRQQMRTIAAPAKRGDIVDRVGRLLATSVDVDTIYAVPSEIGDEAAAVTRLCEAFGDCTGKERQLLLDRLRRQSAFAYVRRQVPPEEAQRVAALGVDGIGFMKESRRFYPSKELAAHVLGYVGIDNNGLAGLEAAFDSQISGKPGQLLIQTDARRHAFSRVERPPAAGSSIELTLDEYLQHVAERELHAGVVENRATAATAIVMDPHTGEILAMANEPTFNPNAYREFDEVARRNRAVQDLFEPGSTFKVVTVSAALQEKVLPLDAIIDTNPGQIRVGSSVVHEDAGRNYGVLPLTDVIVRSSNIGAIKIGFRVGTERLSRYVERYGFGRPASPDFPGESPGIVWSQAKWTDMALAHVAMGYQIGVTPLQMVSAVSAVANGGVLMEPRVLRALYRQNRRHVVKPKALHRTIDGDTAAALTTIMEGVVERGTARRAQISGYTIAGKTGTAAKVIGGHYSKSEYNASFVGFIPSKNPVLAIIVVVDSPHGPNGYHGGAVSAPIFKRIAEAALNYLGVPPSIDPAPPVIVARHDGRRTAPPSAATGPFASSPVQLEAGAVPDVRGMSAREAVRTLVSVGLSAHVSGSGLVVSQDPPPGAALSPGAVCRLLLDRGPAALSSTGP